MLGSGHTGLARQLPVGSLLKDKQCQALSCFQLSTNWYRRLLWVGQQPRAGRGEPTVSKDTQHAALVGRQSQEAAPHCETALLPRL